jgi:hypothetical protein
LFEVLQVSKNSFHLSMYLKLTAIHPRYYLTAGLPDFSWFKITKREKYTKLPRTIPNVHKI